jgi:hypothetical protein
LRGRDAERGAHSDLPIRTILDRMRHDGGGRAGEVELLTGIEGASSRPVRKITVREG